MTPQLIQVRFDDFAVDAKELSQLKQSLSELCPTRTRKQHVDRGGVETAVWIVVSYVGLKYLDAVFSELAARHVAFIIEKLKAVFPPKDKGMAFQQAVSLRLSAEDIDLEINLPPVDNPAFYKTLIEKVSAHLKEEPLSETRIERICIPFIPDGPEWMETYFLSERDFDDRYWGVEMWGSGLINDIYDSTEKRLLNVESDKIQ